jgi:hypothetical protein
VAEALARRAPDERAAEAVSAPTEALPVPRAISRLGRAEPSKGCHDGANPWSHF